MENKNYKVTADVNLKVTLFVDDESPEKAERQLQRTIPLLFESEGSCKMYNIHSSNIKAEESDIVNYRYGNTMKPGNRGLVNGRYVECIATTEETRDCNKCTFRWEKCGNLYCDANRRDDKSYVYFKYINKSIY